MSEKKRKKGGLSDGKWKEREHCNKWHRKMWRTDPEWREKRREANKKWRESEKGKEFKKKNSFSSRAKSYGLTPEELAELLSSRKTCDICGKEKNGRGQKGLHVDHDHNTGEVRGLLCGKCNRGLGFFGDSIAILVAAIEYLTEAKRDV